MAGQWHVAIMSSRRPESSVQSPGFAEPRPSARNRVSDSSRLRPSASYVLHVARPGLQGRESRDVYSLLEENRLHEGSHAALDRSLDSHRPCHPHHRLHLQSVRGAPGFRSPRPVYLPSGDGSVGIVDVEGSRRPAAVLAAELDMESASALIDAKIVELGDWRGKTLARIRKIIHEADPGIVEEWKWMGTPTFSHGGVVCTAETYKNVVKMTFGKGASLKDPKRLFNSSLDGKVRRAIDIKEGDTIDVVALKDLIRQAVALNLKGKKT